MQSQDSQTIDDNIATATQPKRAQLGKKEILLLLGILTIGGGALAGGGYWMYSKKGEDTGVKSETSVSKPIETTVNNDPALQFGTPQQQALPPGMTPPVNVVADTQPVDPALAQQQANDEKLLDQRYKSSLIIQGGGNNSVSVGSEGGDASAQKQIPPELQGIFGAMGMNGANKEAQNPQQNVASQGGRFSAGSNIAPSANASHMDNRQYLIMQGKVIDAILVTAVKSDLPGQIIAQVTEPVYGEQGRYQLLPAGTRIFGEYSSNIRYGQAEIAAVWRRAITPQGVQVMLDSPSANGLGIAGIDGGSVNNHFFQTFGTATLLSIIGAGASNTGVSPNDQNNSMSSYRNAALQGFAQQAQNNLQQRANIPPTITIENGHRIKILVAKDLNFSSLYSD